MPQSNLIVDPYHPGSGKVFLTGIQALVRLPLMQRQLDEKHGLKTGGLISGYRGSPLGAYDLQLWKASKRLSEHGVVFQPGLNEDLAATALWGAQIHSAYGETKADGVFGIWYGKGPGVDRTGDVFRTANVIGTSRLGGVLAIAGDDHSAQSSMYPHHTDGIFQAVSMPVIQPSNLEELLTLGLAGIALSRFCGLWVGFKVTAEVIETAATLQLPGLPEFVEPDDFPTPAHGLGWDKTLAWPGERAELERRLIEERLPAARAWIRANRLDREIWRSSSPRLAIVTTGKAHQDVLQALTDMKLGRDALEALGVSLYKVAVSWPLETTGLIEFVQGHERVLVVEEKRACIETQLKEALYNLADQPRPRILGKTDGHSSALLPEVGEFTPAMVAEVLVRLLAADEPSLQARLVDLLRDRCASSASGLPVRRPYFCSGCPHNSSTKVPEGSRSGGGIGCHVMALSQPELRTSTFSQMGGEGAQWIGAAPFSGTDHIFQNLGDGTYQHSGLLAIRAAVAASTNITYKILYNDAVAMTGGQPAEGQPSPASVARQLDAEGVRHIHLVSDNPQVWRGNSELPGEVVVVDRSALDEVQRNLRKVSGVTAIIYEQTCAAEKRRRRKKGSLKDPNLQVYINPRVCEGCGDCSIQSNCIAVEPLETSFGRKRAVNQSACNKDISCTKGLCPSFVEIKGAKLKRPNKERIVDLAARALDTLPTPVIPPLTQPYNLLCAGIGGTGVLTVGALLGAAAHVQGLAASVLDFTGLSQKNGSVLSQVRLARAETDIHAVRIGAGTVDLLLGADLLVAAGTDSQMRLSPNRSRGIVNLDTTPTADVIQNRDLVIPELELLGAIRERCMGSSLFELHANEQCQTLFGSTVAVHTLMLGYAWQKGMLPLEQDSILRAIELNGTAVSLNQQAFAWGRILAVHPDFLEKSATPSSSVSRAELSIVHKVEQFARELENYQSKEYAARYRELMDRVQRFENRIRPGSQRLASVVSQAAFRVMAYKDEYEVARLYASEEFIEGIKSKYERFDDLSVWLAPPLFSKIDKATGRPIKKKYGAWAFRMFGVLAGLKSLRGTPFDIFGYTEERREERNLIQHYRELVERLLCVDQPERFDELINIAGMVLEVRGYGVVKEQALARYKVSVSTALEALDKPLTELIFKQAV